MRVTRKPYYIELVEDANSSYMGDVPSFDLKPIKRRFKPRSIAKNKPDALTSGLSGVNAMDSIAKITNEIVPVLTAGFSSGEIQALKNTVAKDATDDEFTVLMRLATTYGLDPFRKEIWCIKRKKEDPALIMTSRDGYLKIAKCDPGFDGLQAFVVKEGDEFNIDAGTGTVTHSFKFPRGKIIGAWAVAHHKGRRPVSCFVEFAEYNNGSPVWQKYPSAMIQKVAEAFVLKRQYDINGLTTQEEMTVEAVAGKSYDIEADYTDLGMTERQRQEIAALVKKLGWTQETGADYLYRRFKKQSSASLTTSEAELMIDDLRAVVTDNE